jgi:hypothetical protein
MHMRNRQQGMTMIGWLLVMIPVAIVVYAGIRITPVYLNYYRVVRSLQQLGIESRDDAQRSVNSLRTSLDKRFDIEYVDHPKANQVEFTRVNGTWVATVDYEDLAPLFSNISLLAQFHKEVVLP